MDELSREFILACKTSNPHENVMNVFRENYSNHCTQPQAEHSLVDILSTIVDTFLEVRLTSILSELHPEKRWQYGASAEDTIDQVINKRLMSEIRNTVNNKFPDLIKED